MKIITSRQHVDWVAYRLSFDYVREKNIGFSFDCDENGVVNEESLNPAAFANLQACRTGTVRGEAVGAAKIERDSGTRHIPAVGLCECGLEVELANFTNTCDCNRDYNSSGMLLAPRQFWGEETGESVDQILSYNGMSAEELLDGNDY